MADLESLYEAILKDLDAAFALNSLSENPAKMRVGLAFAYAAKAKILMSMRDYDEAFEAAEASLKLKSTIDDYNDKLALSEMNKAQYGIEVYEFSRYYLARKNSGRPRLGGVRCLSRMNFGMSWRRIIFTIPHC